MSNRLQVNIATAYVLALGERKKEENKRTKKVKKIISVIGRAVVNPWIQVSLWSTSDLG
jgi:hypothetical protein